MQYWFYLAVSFVISLLLTPIVRWVAFKIRVVDEPKENRKIHNRPMPLLGGVAVFFAIIISTLVLLGSGSVNFLILPLKFFVGIGSGLLVLVLGGVIDDKYNLPPKVLWIFPGLAALIVVLSGVGVGITQLSNPFGAPIKINYLFLGLPLSGILVWVWLMGMVFTTKFLDGLDGLASGIGVIASVSLFFLSLTAKVNQPVTAVLAIILAGSLLGFLFYNFNPASIFLGEAGSTLIGFSLGVLSVILGGKIATAFLVMGIPILDVAWVIVRRIYEHKSPFKADRKHLHFRLLDKGFSQRQSVLILYALSAVFGFTAVFLQSRGKLIALAVLVVTMLILASVVVFAYKRRANIVDTNQ